MNGTYTVTSSVDEAVNSLSILDKHATLLIEGTSPTGFTTFTTQTGGVNDGPIALNDGFFVGDAGTFTNNHLISGSGGIHGGFNFSSPLSFTLVNAAGAVIDGVNGLDFAGVNIENSGILETTSGSLDFLADFSPAFQVHNSPQGVIEANGNNTSVFFGGPVTVIGGTIKSVGTNALVFVGVSGDTLFDGSEAGNPLHLDGDILVSYDLSLTLRGIIDNHGAITEQSSPAPGAEIGVDGNVTLEGGGKIILGVPVNPSLPHDGVFLNSGGFQLSVLTNVDNVISGTGFIYSFNVSSTGGSLINELKGVVDANVTGASLVLGGDHDSNAGLMEATGGGTLLFENMTIDNFLNHTNGTVEAGQGSIVGLENATIVGGNIHVTGQLLVTGNVSLQGNGDVHLSGGEISGFGTLSTDNTISGSGDIGNVGGPILTNEVTGVIDANDPNAPLTIDATPVKDTSLTNAGLLEATHGGTLVLSGIISNTTTGTLEAHHGSTIALEGGNIFGGTVTVLHGATIEAEQAAGTIFAAVVTNAGTIGAEGANLTINGDVTNAKGTLDANNSTLEIDGAVNGGRATIEGTGEIGFGGPSSADVRFGSSSDAILKLENPSTFTGTVFGLPTGAYLDLTNINFANDPTISYSSKTHLLTVTDSVAGVTDTISLKHVSGSFSAQSDGNGGTLIADTSPPNTVAICHDQDSFVFAASPWRGSSWPP